MVILSVAILDGELPESLEERSTMGRVDDLKKLRKELQGYLEEAESEYKMKSREVEAIITKLNGLRLAVSGLSWLGEEERKPRRIPKLPGDNQKVKISDHIEALFHEPGTLILTVADIVRELAKKGLASGHPKTVGTFTGIMNHDERFFRIDKHRFCLAEEADRLTVPGAEDPDPELPISLGEDE